MPKKRPSDPATRYAGLVVRDKHQASDDVKFACERHLKDLEKGQHLWLPERAKRFEYFCEDCCFVENQVTMRTEPFKLLPWEQFCAYSLFGWAVKEGDRLKRVPGARRFQYMYLETGKGAGKSPFATAIDLYILTADVYIDLAGNSHPQLQPQCFITASTKEQATDVAMRPAKMMVEMSDRLQDEAGCRVLGGDNPDRIISTRTGGFIQVVGSHFEGRGRAGLRVSLVHWEEPHESVTRAQVNALEAGFKGRTQPLELIATNAGKSKEGPAWAEHQKAKLCARGDGADNYLAFIATVSDDDRPAPGSKRWYPAQRTWSKANPSLGSVIRKDYILSRIEKATTTEDRMEVLRLNFGLWGTIDSELCSEAQWRKVLINKIDEADIQDAKLFMAFDVGEVNDLTALACLWYCADDKYRLRVHYYTPRDTLRERHDVSSGNLLEWAEQGWIETCDGSIVDYEWVAERIKEMYESYDCTEIASDSYKIREMRNAFNEVGLRWWIDDDRLELHYHEGVELVFHPQEPRRRDKSNPRALWMPGSINRFEKMVKEQEILIEQNPVLNWNLSSAIIVRDKQMNRTLDKRQSFTQNQGKIDGLVAAIEAAGLADRDPPARLLKSPWEDPHYSIMRQT